MITTIYCSGLTSTGKPCKRSCKDRAGTVWMCSDHARRAFYDHVMDRAS
jgi:hypothetical protein